MEHYMNHSIVDHCDGWIEGGVGPTEGGVGALCASTPLHTTLW
jgi:hypothetical protein